VERRRGSYGFFTLTGKGFLIKTGVAVITRPGANDSFAAASRGSKETNHPGYDQPCGLFHKDTGEWALFCRL